jgi:hypothetical protein
MGTLEDQLKKWKQQQPANDPAARQPATALPRGAAKALAPRATAAPVPASSAEPTRGRATKKEPFPAFVVRRDEPSAPPPSSDVVPPVASPSTDAELFARAIAAVDVDVVLQKFAVGAEPASAGRGSRDRPPTPPISDQELFRSFVGDARPKGPAATKDRPAGAAAGPRLSLRGATAEAAARRLRAFLEDAVRAGAAVVVVEIDPTSEAAVDAVRGHAAVASVHDATPAQGGKGARVLRLRS